jgi:outer membrane immunogenic protein
MLRKQVELGGLFENPRKIAPRRAGLFKPLMAISVLALAFTAAAGPAQADGPFFGPRDGVVERDFLEVGVFNWSGLYFGGHIGGAFGGDVDWTVDDAPFVPTAGFLAPGAALPEDSKVSHDLDGVIAGAHLGFNQQFGRWVFGFETSLSGTDLNGSSTHVGPELGVAFGCVGVTCQERVSLETQIDWLALATLRLGYTWDRWLLYLKGGYATGDVHIRGNEEISALTLGGAALTPPVELITGHFDSSERHHGWHIGVGLEKAFPSFGGCCNNLILGLEYNFIDLDSEQHTTKSNIFCGDGNGVIATACIGADPGQEIRRKRADFDVDPDGIHTVKVRLSYKFGCCEQAAVLPPLK